MPELPWIKWYPTNWASDPGLAMCDSITRGVWFEAVNAMLLLGKPSINGTDEQLCRLLRCRPTQLQLAVSEIKAFNVGDVFEQNGNTTLTCRRLLREFKIKELRSKAGLLSSTKRQHNTQHPSASAYASASKSVPVLGKCENPFTEETTSRIQASLSAMFNRKADDPWSYADECALLEVMRRPGAALELVEIEEYRKRSGKYFPRSVSTLLTKWDSTLDAARNTNNHDPDSKRPKTMLEREVESIERSLK